MVDYNSIPDYVVDYGGLMKDLFHPGTNYITQGLRGGGKTYSAVAYAYHLVNGTWPEVGKVILLTNVIFLKRIKKSPGNPKTDYTDKETPENVYHIDTMEEMFRNLAQLMNENPKRDVLYLILLDEAQNFFNSYDAQSPMSKELQKWFGTLRKFDACLWMMTPSIRNVPPKGRTFNDDPSSPGYLNGIWTKNKMITERDMRLNNLIGDSRAWITLSVSHDDTIRRYLRVPNTPWNTPYEQLKVGEFGYDHMASADFTMGSEDFNFGKLMTKVSNTASLWMSDAMNQFFDDMDKHRLDEEDSMTHEILLKKFLMIKEMDKMNITDKDQSTILSEPSITFRRTKKNLYQKFNGKYLADQELETIVNNLLHRKGRKEASIGCQLSGDTPNDTLYISLGRGDYATARKLLDPDDIGPEAWTKALFDIYIDRRLNDEIQAAE